MIRCVNYIAEQEDMLSNEAGNDYSSQLVNES